MPSVHVITRRTKAGAARYLVRYRLGGRETPIRHGGSFPTRRLADERARWIGGELAAGRVPDLDLAARVDVRGPSLEEWGHRFAASRIDASAATLSGYGKALARLGPLGAAEALSVTPADVAAWVAGLAAAGLKRATITAYLGTVRQVLDHAGVEPNPPATGASACPGRSARRWSRRRPRRCPR